MKTLILHIGSHKTATTFVQGSLAHSPEVLRKAGLLYPTTGRIYDAHFELCWALKDSRHKKAALEDLPLWAALMEEIDQAAEETILLSSEEFGLGLNPARLAVLTQRYKVRVIYYLRSPDSHLESFYNQFVKDADPAETRTLDQFLLEDATPFLDTMARLAPWAELFGPQAIQLRLFSQACARPGGLMQDFLEAIDCRSALDLATPPRSSLHKVALPPDALEYMRALNAHSHTAQLREDQRHRFVVDLVAMTQAHRAQLSETRAGLMSLKAKRKLRRRYASSNQRAAQAFLDSAHTPFPPTDALAHPGFDTRLAEATPSVLGRVAAFLAASSSSDK